MAGMKYYAGNHATGWIDRSTPLPTIVGDSVSEDINGAQKSVIKIAKDEFPTRGYWRTNLKQWDTAIILDNEDVPWDDENAIMFVGYLSGVPATIGDVITLAGDGEREYTAARGINRLWNDVLTDPSLTYDYSADTWQGVQKSLWLECYSSAGIPAGANKPPAILGNVSGDVTGTGIVYKVKPTDFSRYNDSIEDIRNTSSATGNEYRLKGRYLSSARDQYVVDVIIGSDTNPHINENQTFTINLVDDEDANNDDSFSILNFTLNQESREYYNRIIIQTKAGDDKAKSGADLTTKTSTSGPNVLVDGFFNPNIELTEAKKNEQADAYLSAATKEKLSGSLIVSGDAATWRKRLGMMIEFKTKAGLTDGFHATMRMTDIRFSASENKIEIGFMSKAPRYPRLPRTAPSSDKLGGGGGGVPDGDSNTSPPRKKKPWNWKLPPDPYGDKDDTPPGGGGGGGETDGDGTGTSWGGGSVGTGGIPTYKGLTETSLIACGTSMAFAIASNGALYSWGYGPYGELGDGVYGASTGTSIPSQIGTDTDWVSVYAAESVSIYALKQDKSLWAWTNPWGAPSWNGQGLQIQKVMDNVRNVYTKNARAVFVIKEDGTLWVAGLNHDQTHYLGLGYIGNMDVVEFTQIGTKTDWIRFEGNNDGAYYAAIDANGVLWHWGFGIWQMEPYPVSDTLKFDDFMITTAVGGGAKNWYVGAKEKDTNKLYTWGHGYHDTSGTPTFRNSPMIYGGTVDTIYGFTHCEGTHLRPYHVITYIDNDGKLWAFGRGTTWGWLWEQVEPIEIGIDTGFDWRNPHYLRTNLDGEFMAIIEGKLWVAGYNYHGQLGIGHNYAIKHKLEQIGQGRGWKRLDVSKNGTFSLAVSEDNMFATGRGYDGQTGMGYYTATGYPVEDKTNFIYSWTIQPTSKTQE